MPKKILLFVLVGAQNLWDELILLSEILLIQKYYPDARITLASYDPDQQIALLRTLLAHVEGMSKECRRNVERVSKECRKSVEDVKNTPIIVKKCVEDVEENVEDVKGDTSKLLDQDRLDTLETFSYFPNGLKKHPWKNVQYFFRQSAASMMHDWIIVGGGGIFFDNEVGVSFRKILFEWKMRLAWARWFWKQVRFFGISVEVKNIDRQKQLSGIFRPSDRVLVRDTFSAKILDRQGIYADVGYDPVFSLPPRMPPMPVVQPKKIGISLRGGFFSQEQIQMMQKGIQWLIKQGKEVVFLSHSLCGDIYHNDRLFVEEHFGTAYPLTTSLEETLEMYASLDAVIAMRLHSAILAARYGIPVLALPYGPKGMSLTSLLDIDEYTIDTESFSFERFQSIFSSLCDNYQNAQQKIIASYQQIHEKFLKKIEESGILDG